MAKMMRISNSTSTNLEELQQTTKKTKQKLIEIAVEKLYREYFLHKTNKEYDKLKKDKKTWAEEQKEQNIWEITNLL